MNIFDVLNVFNISAKKLIEKNDVAKWKQVLKAYRDFDQEEVEKELEEIKKLQTFGSSYYYLLEVRKRMLLKNHYSLKQLGMPKFIKALFNDSQEKS